MPTKKELLEYMRKYKKANCPAVSTLKKDELERVAKKHGFGTTSTQPSVQQGRSRISRFFADDEKKETTQPRPRTKTKQKKPEEKKQDVPLDKQLENLLKVREALKKEAEPFNKVIFDMEASVKDTKAAKKKKDKLKINERTLQNNKDIREIKKKIEDAKK